MGGRSTRAAKRSRRDEEFEALSDEARTALTAEQAEATRDRRQCFFRPFRPRTRVTHCTQA